MSQPVIMDGVRPSKSFQPYTRPNHPKEPPKMVCLNCLEAAAQLLPLRYDCACTLAFCSVECAAEYGCSMIIDSEITWCLTHGHWTDEDGACCDCWFDSLPEEQRKFLMAEAETARREGVDRGQFCFEAVGLQVKLNQG